MSARPIGERAMTSTERGRRFNQKDEQYRERLKTALMASSDALLEAGRDAQGRGDVVAAGKLFRAAEAATLAIDSHLEGVSLANKLMRDHERKQEAYAMQRAQVGAASKAKFAHLAVVQKED